MASVEQHIVGFKKENDLGEEIKYPVIVHASNLNNGKPIKYTSIRLPHDAIVHGLMALDKSFTDEALGSIAQAVLCNFHESAETARNHHIVSLGTPQSFNVQLINKVQHRHAVMMQRANATAGTTDRSRPPTMDEMVACYADSVIMREVIKSTTNTYLHHMTEDDINALDVDLLRNHTCVRNTNVARDPLRDFLLDSYNAGKPVAYLDAIKFMDDTLKKYASSNKKGTSVLQQNIEKILNKNHTLTNNDTDPDSSFDIDGISLYPDNTQYYQNLLFQLNLKNCSSK